MNMYKIALLQEAMNCLRGTIARSQQIRKRSSRRSEVWMLPQSAWFDFALVLVIEGMILQEEKCSNK